jgi:hypothetical protein
MKKRTKSTWILNSVIITNKKNPNNSVLIRTELKKKFTPAEVYILCQIHLLGIWF